MVYVGQWVWLGQQSFHTTQAFVSPHWQGVDVMYICVHVSAAYPTYLCGCVCAGAAHHSPRPENSSGPLPRETGTLGDVSIQLIQEMSSQLFDSTFSPTNTLLFRVSSSKHWLCPLTWTTSELPHVYRWWVQRSLVAWWYIELLMAHLQDAMV